MYFREPEGETSLLRSPAAALALALAALAVLAIGLLPDPYLVMGEKAAGSLAAFGRM
jgi:NADH:ubiquinone oxidoreductase subunit 2 (subunit N)